MFKSWLRNQFAGVALGVCAFATVAGGAMAEDLRTFKFASIGDRPTSAAEIYFGLGLEKGWFKEAGVDFQVIRMFSNVAYPAIVAGEIDGALYGSSAAIAALRGAPLTVAYFDQVSSPWSLIVDPKKIAAPADFEGARCVAATGAKTATHIAWAAMIDAIGGNPVTFQAKGIGQPPPFWLEALRVGTAECILGFDAAWARLAEREGFKMLAYLPDLRPMQANGLTVAKAAFTDPEKRELIKDVISVFLRSHDYIRVPENRAEVATLVAGWMGNPKDLEPSDFEAAVEEIAKLVPEKGYIEDDSVIDNMLRASIQYGIYDPNEFPKDPTNVSLVSAGVVDQSLVKEVVAWGGPLYKRP